MLFYATFVALIVAGLSEAAPASITSSIVAPSITQALSSSSIPTQSSNYTQSPTSVKASVSRYIYSAPTYNPTSVIQNAVTSAVALEPKPDLILPFGHPSTCQTLISAKAVALAANVGQSTSGFVSDANWGTTHMNYQWGAIYCHDVASGAHAVYGEIWEKWVAQNGNYGYPITDEMAGNPSNPNLIRYNIFSQNGAIYWTSEYGAHLIYGEIYGRWQSIGGATSVLGVPITDETGEGSLGGRYNDFANGMIYWTPNGRSYVVEGALPDSISWKWDPINIGQVTGSTTVSLHSNGNAYWTSNIHDNTAWNGYWWGETWVVCNADGTTVYLGQSGFVGPNFSGYPFGNANDNNINTAVFAGDILINNWRAWVAFNWFQPWIWLNDQENWILTDEGDGTPWEALQVDVAPLILQQPVQIM